jgi:hypothetical protein
LYEVGSLSLLGNGSKMARESASVNISLPPHPTYVFALRKEFHLREELKGGKKCSKSSKEL